MSNRDYMVTINIGKAGKTIIAHCSPAGCDNPGCHMNAPPEHILQKQSHHPLKSRCNNCHNLALKIHPNHYRRVPHDANGCQVCHVNSSCLIGLRLKISYNPHNKTCPDCHGTLNDSTKGLFRIRKQAGLPRCDNCHDKEYSYPVRNSFKDSYGHGGVACINCHASTHLGNHTSIGYNACARACHTTQPYKKGMGVDCAKCHASSVAPHLVKKIE